MTHFIGAVVAPPEAGGVELEPTPYPDLYGEDAKKTTPTKELEEYLGKALAKFDEGVEAEPYVTSTEWEAELESARTWGRDPKNTSTKTPAQSDDDEKWLRWYNGEWRPDGDGGFQLWSTYNPDSKWDWWTIGGRWEKQYRERQGETAAGMLEKIERTREALADPEQVARVAEKQAALKQAGKAYYSAKTTFEREEADKLQEELYEDLRDEPGFLGWSFPYSIVHPEGEGDFEWSAKGDMGWFGMSNDQYSDDEWLDRLTGVLQAVPPTSTIWYIDFHI